MIDYLGTPDWGSSRSIYRNLSEELNVLTDAYAVEVDERTKLMLDHLILAIDEVDQYVDELPTLEERNETTSSILDYLMDDKKEWRQILAPESLSLKMQTLRSIVFELDVVERFHKAVSDIFDYTERKRHTLSEAELIEFVMLEGKATAELPLSILKIDADHKFGEFFNNLCKLMGVADLVIDAKSDFKSDYISIKPKLGMYFTLNSILVKEGLRLVWSFPQKLRFFVYCTKFTVLLFLAKD